MSDRTDYDAAPDHTRIVLDEERELRYWTEALRTSVNELRDAVFAAGDHPSAVRRFLGR